MSALFTSLQVTVALTWAQEILRYFLIAGFVFTGIVLIGTRFFNFSKIRARSPARRQYFREAFNSLRSILIYILVAIAVTLAARSIGWYPLDATGPSAMGLFYYFNFILILVVHDTYFYWTHRALHHPVLFRFHREHHKSHNPSPWAAYSFSPSEAVVHGFFLAVYAFVVPTADEVIGFFLTVQLLLNAIGHSGVEIYPKWLVMIPRVGGYTGTTHHDIHHATSKHNYGLYFRYWDRIAGTEHPRFAAIYAHVRSSSNSGDGYRLYLSRS
jgi:sterol desaturase/sphingolipid hydroxylase (fatty acid hydroxylase superfamily)